MPNRLTILCIIVLLTSGCSHLVTPKQSFSDEFNELVAQDSYGKALAALDNLAPSSPQYKQRNKLRKLLIEKATAYEKKLISQSTNEQRQDHWEKAELILKTGIRNYPEGKQLQRALEQYNEDLQKWHHDIELKLMISRGEWLVKEIELRELRLKASSSDFIEKLTISGLKSEATTLFSKIRGEGINALERNDIKLATHLLPLANDLHRSPETEHAIKQLQKRINIDKQREQHSLERQQTRERKNLIKQFEHAINQEELQRARQLLLQIEKHDVDDKKLSTLRKELAIRIDNTVEELIQKGNRYYSQSNYALAIQYWEKAKLLKPEDTRIDSQIERAKRIIINLQELEKE